MCADDFWPTPITYLSEAYNRRNGYPPFVMCTVVGCYRYPHLKHLVDTVCSNSALKSKPIMRSCYERELYKLRSYSLADQ